MCKHAHVNTPRHTRPSSFLYSLPSLIAARPGIASPVTFCVCTSFSDSENLAPVILDVVVLFWLLSP